MDFHSHWVKKRDSDAMLEMFHDMTLGFTFYFYFICCNSNSLKKLLVALQRSLFRVSISKKIEKST